MHTFPDFRCPAEAMGLVGIVFSVIPMWIALGRGRWSIRAAIGVAAIGLLIPLRAYQPIVFFSITGVGSVLLLSFMRFFARRDQVSRSKSRTIRIVWRRPEFWLGTVIGFILGLATLGWAVRTFGGFGWLETLLVFVPVFSNVLIVSMLFGDTFRHGPRRVARSDSVRHSFRLFDIMTVVVLLAVLFSVNLFAINALALQRNSIAHWLSVFIAAGMMVGVTVSTAGIFAASQFRWRLVSLAVLLIVIGCSSQFGAIAGKWLMQASAFSFLPGAPWSSMIGLYSAMMLATTLCVTTAGLFRFREIDSLEVRGTRQIGYATTGCLLVLYSACLVPIAIEMMKPLAKPDEISDGATVYYQLEAAMAPLVALNPKEQTLDELVKAGKTKIAGTIAASYASIRQMARQKFRAPDPLVDDFDLIGLGQKLTVIRSWARCTEREANALVKNQKFSEASGKWIECINVGHGLGRGSDVSYTLTGIAIEGVGQVGLLRIRNDLPVDKVEALLATLIAIDGLREPVDSIRRRSDLLMERQMNWQYRLSLCASAHLSAQSPSQTTTLVSPSIEATEDAIHRRDAAMRMLMTEFAIQLFIAKYDRVPMNISELVPEFFNKVPLDPFTGQPLVYRRQDDGFVIYSTGTDREDNGGQFGDIMTFYQDDYDFDLDTLTRPVRPNTPGAFGGGMGGGR